MNRTPIFAAVRHLLARPLIEADVRALDSAIDAALELPAPLAVSPQGAGLVRRSEGLAKLRPDGMVEAYPDPATGADPWTIGWGATGEGIGPGTVWTRTQCDARLETDLARHAEEVADAIGDAPTSQQQFDALVSFHYNTGAIARATLTRRHIAGDYAGAAEEFSRWVYAAGKVMKGLVRRREAEAEVYRGRSCEQ
ncbi:lysozyme [Aurantiacibacter suaedae]|uniref:lysozyme n=1 Tax=Aurantiacibacter suaedae TaxID=2545755 RepID=UPI0010F5A0D4|nr:lysozyme [Aurantiacibacter suaedae]